MSTTDEQLASNDSAPADQTSVSATTTSTAKTKKRPALRSPLWEDFIPIYILEGDPPVERRVGKCKQCGVIIQALGNQGTNGLKNHSESCKRKVKESHKQPAFTYEPSGAEKGGKVVWVFDQEEVRLALVEMIILDELPFIFVEKVGFVRFMKRCCPMFDIPGRKTIRTDCVKIFLERKDSLKSFFNSKGSGTISITTDCWTSLRNHSFICLTAHFIGRNWQLHKKIINFKKITSHKGEDVADSIITCLDEWGIKRVLCCTLDNASANDVAIRHLRERLQLRVGNTLDGRFLHMRCVAHIINLVVQTGIEVIGISVRPRGMASELVLGVRVVLSELVEAYRHHLLPPRPPRDADVDASQGSNSGSASAKRQRVADALKRRSDRVLKMIGLPSFNIMPLPPGSGSCSGGRGVAGGGGDIDTANGGGGVASGCGSGSAASSGV
ncbi:Putative AC transposase [Linum perenne]